MPSLVHSAAISDAVVFWTFADFFKKPGKGRGEAPPVCGGAHGL